MRNKNVQMSFEDIYNGVSESMENRKSELVSLLEEHINLDELIPHSFHTAFYRRMGRGHLYHLDSFIWFLILKKLLGLSQNTQMITILKLSRELRDLCGFDKVPDASQITRFYQNYCEQICAMFEHLVDITEPICRAINEKKADYLIYDTTGIEANVAENNPKFFNTKLKEAKRFAKGNESYNPYIGVYSLLPSESKTNPEIRQQYVNGHFCYAAKAAVLTNGLGVVRHISVFDNTFRKKHPECVTKRTDNPDTDKEIGDSYLGINPMRTGESTVTIATSSDTSASTTVDLIPETSKLDELIQRATANSQLSGRGYHFGNAGSLNVRAYELNRGEIKYRGERRPCFFNSDGIDCDFVYDPTHPVLTQYPITPKMLLLIYLAEKLKARDSLPDLVSVYTELIETAMQESKIDRQTLQDRASSAFELLREKLREALRNRKEEAVNCIHKSTGEVEDTIASIIQNNPALLNDFQSNTEAGFDAIDYVPPKTLYRLVDSFPEDVFDGKALATPYMTINLQDENATQRAREDSKERALAFIKDALHIVSGYSQKIQKNELTRAALSVDFLLKELNT